MPSIDEALAFAQAIGAREMDMCILAEGNISARADDGSFWVKGSGIQMGKMSSDGLSRVEFAPLLAAISSGNRPSDVQLRSLLDNARIEGPSPSTEAFMHAALLQREVRFVAHGHPTALLAVLCMDGADEFARRRLFPDEIVLCGPASCFVPYVAPGLDLARKIILKARQFEETYGLPPKTLWLQNHGLICVGKTAQEAQSACEMAVKAARVLLGALQAGREIRWMTPSEVAHIANWPDEHARQKALWSTDRSRS